jgi:hypothetical protein
LKTSTENKNTDLILPTERSKQPTTKYKIAGCVVLYIFSLCFFFTGKAFCAGAKGNDSLKYYDGQEFTIIGRFHSEKTYARFPLKYKNILRQDVWDLGQQSAGESIRFNTNASTIVVRWSVKGDETIDPMSATGIRGVDLYAFVDGRWMFMNTGQAQGNTNEYTLVTTGGEIFREYLLNLPLHDGLESLSIGIDHNATISKPKENYLITQKPVVYYGSSIAQGVCASRPGMAFTNILSRAMDRSFINMGFCGNGTFDLSVGEAMCEINAALYVIDCTPNTDKELIYERAVGLVKFLKEKKPEIPVLLIDCYDYEIGFIKSVDSDNEKKRIELRRAYAFLKSTGIQQLYYKSGEGLVGNDHEGTVDDVHPNDLGMMRIAKALQPEIQKIIK